MAELRAADRGVSSRGGLLRSHLECRRGGEGRCADVPDTIALCESRAMESRAVEPRRSPGLSACWPVFGAGSPDLGVSDIARILELKTSTTHRLIRTLVNAGFLERDPRTSRYRLGNALAEYGQIVYRQRRVDVAEPHLRRLSQVTGENVALAVRHGSDALLLTGAQAPWSETHDVTGIRIPLHASAMGKVLMAWADERDGDPAHIGPLTPATPRTITDPAALRRELERTRVAGYALNDEEMTPGHPDGRRAHLRRRGACPLRPRRSGARRPHDRRAHSSHHPGRHEDGGGHPRRPSGVAAAHRVSGMSGETTALGLDFCAKGSSPQSVIANPGSAEPGRRTCVQLAGGRDLRSVRPSCCRGRNEGEPFAPAGKVECT